MCKNYSGLCFNNINIRIYVKMYSHYYLLQYMVNHSLMNKRKNHSFKAVLFFLLFKCTTKFMYEMKEAWDAYIWLQALGSCLFVPMFLLKNCRFLLHYIVLILFFFTLFFFSINRCKRFSKFTHALFFYRTIVSSSWIHFFKRSLRTFSSGWGCHFVQVVPFLFIFKLSVPDRHIHMLLLFFLKINLVAVIRNESRILCWNTELKLNIEQSVLGLETL